MTSRISYVVPEFYGEARAIESMSSVAAPLLAGGGIAITGVIIQQENALAAPGIVLILLVIAIFSLIFAVQCGFWARQHAATPDEIEQWHRGVADEELRREIVEDDQKDDAASFRLWAQRSRWSFGLGVVFLWAGVGLALVPKDGSVQEAARWIAAVLAFSAGALEVLWMVAAMMFRERFRRLFFG